MKAPRVHAPHLSSRRPVSAHRAVGEMPELVVERGEKASVIAGVVVGAVLLAVDGVLLWSAVGELASW